jgi:4-hydroxy-tetrahydrodipicolinate synthase
MSSCMAGQLVEARALAFRHFPMIDFVAGQQYVAGTKALLAAMGLPVGAPRPPRLPLGAEGFAAAEAPGRRTRPEDPHHP